MAYSYKTYSDIKDIMKKYVMGHKKLDVTEMFPHDELFLLYSLAVPLYEYY